MNVSVNYAKELRHFLNNSIRYNGMNDINEESLNKIQDAYDKFKSNFTFHKNDSFIVFLSEVFWFVNRSASLTIDEKLILLIRLIDPNFSLFKLYNSTDFISNFDIMMQKDINERKSLILKKKSIEQEFEIAARDLIGFYHEILLKGETDYYSKLNFSAGLFEDEFYDSKNIIFSVTDEMLDRIVNLVVDYKIKNSKANFKLVDKEMKKDMQKFGVTTTLEAALFMIMLFDPDLKFGHILIDESNYEVMKKRALDEIGFYSKDFMYLVYNFGLQTGQLVDEWQIKKLR